jgi:hypothetical protein
VTWDDYAWIVWAVAFLVIEGIALFNSTWGDTLSEHVWAFLGVRGGRADENHRTGDRITPKWTLRLARFVMTSGLVWVVIHLTTNWM